MGHWKFIATWMTDKECYIRRLFGNERKQIDKTGDELDVKEGDTLYLHRWGNEDEPGQLDGPFIAACDAGKDLEPDAWRHRGKYDWQVRIDWEDTVYSMNIDKINEGDAVDIKHYPQALTEVQGMFLSGLLKRKGTPIINEK